ncbi:hypothetical protein GYMLUDRAFT_892872 [Collybiopsis luxurians FD-317 M1]|uniref:Uncharacterized protein n=1 Tax=Collybiopsis luxurians FD-317 M1 TaxID=944289 RepID=A0A0D0AVW5_9AGAR|nr:hypothetical protein GYMLUDRAFT_892872 [Collybiopsis luxurians FD-317 M1]
MLPQYIALFLGLQIPVSLGIARDWSIAIYSVLLVPGINLILPVMLFRAFYGIYDLLRPSQRRKINSGTQSEASIVPILTGLTVLAIINVIFVVDTEIMLATSSLFKESHDAAEWTFGQTIALLLLVLPIRDLIEGIMRKPDTRRRKQHTRNLRKAVERGSPDLIMNLVKDGANVNVEVNPKSKFASALQLASYKGDLGLVLSLLNNGADVNRKGIYNTAIQAAMCQKHEIVIQILAERVDFKDAALGPALTLWRDTKWDLGFGSLVLMPQKFWKGKKNTPRGNRSQGISPRCTYKFFKAQL